MPPEIIRTREIWLSTPGIFSNRRSPMAMNRMTAVSADSNRVFPVSMLNAAPVFSAYRNCRM